MKRILITFCIFYTLLFSQQAFAQFQGPVYQYDTSVKVFVGTTEQTMAWCGGFNKPQFAMADLNKDGKQDLVVFDTWQGIRTFINIGVAGNPKYVFAPKYALNFPPVTNYLILADYNCDTVADLFTQQSADGFVVYKGYYNVNHELCFSYIGPLNYYDSTQNSYWPTYNNPGDIPAIVDIDNDGDLDFVAKDILGNSIILYKNMQVEMSLPCDSIRLVASDRFWGRIHGTWGSTGAGNSLCLVDYDLDGDYDLLTGYSQYNNLSLFIDQRLPSNSGPDSLVLSDSLWQNGHRSVNVSSYPTAYNIDIDQDGKKDILVTPTNDGENYKCTWLYKNNSTPGNPSWSFQSDTFFTAQSIDIGTAAYPQFFDYNKDGKPDLFIGSDGYYQSNDSLRSRISYYLNTSTPGNPSFTLQTKDFLGMNANNFKGTAPAFGDLDNDGIQDMVIGHTNGTLSFYRNAASSDNVTPQWQLSSIALADANNVVINVGQYAAPFIYDIDKDGKPDLVIGSKNGKLAYYQNISTTAGQIKLKLVNTALGNIRTDPNYFSGNNSTPFIGKMDNTGKDYILCGANSGLLYRYDGFQSGDTTATYQMIDSAYSYIDTLYNYYNPNHAAQVFYDGFRTAPTVADIDGDGKYEMVVGDIFGGVMIYKQVLNVPVSVEQTQTQNSLVKVYPNPAKNTLNISWGTSFADNEINISIYTLAGVSIYRNTLAVSQGHFQVSTLGLTPGVYYCSVQSTKNKVTTIVTILK